MNAVLVTSALDYLAGLSSDSVDLCYIDPPFNTGHRQQTLKGSGSYEDAWPSREAYMDWLKPHLAEIRRVLTHTGSVFVHVDHRTSHYVKVALDSEFGEAQFVNNIVWCYQSGGAGQRHFARKHDDILFYAKTPAYKFNVLREPYPQNRSGQAGFHPDGRAMNDWWPISIMSTTAVERTGYPSQKPSALLERIILATTDPGDVVLDCFCGSGTSGSVALKLGRVPLLCDSNPLAVELSRQRMNILEERIQR